MTVNRFRLFTDSELDVLSTALYNLKGQGKVTRIQELELDFLAEEIAVERESRIPETAGNYLQGRRS